MSNNTVSESRERDLEVSIIRAFATAIIEFEPVLYQKFLLQTRGIITEDLFKETLTKMEEKGYVVPLKFQGRQCWRRIATEDDVTAEYYDQEEVREMIEKTQTLIMQKKSVPKGEISFVSQTRRTAQEVLDLAKSQMPEIDDSEEKTREKLRYHFESMRQALADSKENLMDYVKQNMPWFYDQIKQVLESKGEDVLLPAFRIIEAGLLEPNS